VFGSGNGLSAEGGFPSAAVAVQDVEPGLQPAAQFAIQADQPRDRSPWPTRGVRVVGCFGISLRFVEELAQLQQPPPPAAAATQRPATWRVLPRPPSVASYRRHDRGSLSQ